MRHAQDTGLSDEVLIKMAKELGIDVPTVEVHDGRIKVSNEQIKQLRTAGNMLGGGFVKSGSRVWQLKKEGEDLYLERMENEPGVE